TQTVLAREIIVPTEREKQIQKLENKPTDPCDRRTKHGFEKTNNPDKGFKTATTEIASNSPAWSEAARSGNKPTAHNKRWNQNNQTVPCKQRSGGTTTEEV
ncbi:hypothetical protein A2U01_0070597, partial [Trifolium medium]|nr:hypothetical protein [Trifolium medium]